MNDDWNSAMNVCLDRERTLNSICQGAALKASILSILFLCVIAVLAVIQRYRQDLFAEQVRLNLLAPLAANALSGEIFIGESRSIRAVTEDLVRKHHLTEVVVGEKPHGSCREMTVTRVINLAMIGERSELCIEKVIDVGQRQAYLTLKAETPRFSLSAGLPPLLLMGLPLFLFGVFLTVRIRRDLTLAIARPLEALAKNPLAWEPMSGRKVNPAREVKLLAGQLRAYEVERERQRADAERNKTAQAIAQTTQMVAHDVRKPFTTMKVGLNLLLDPTNDEAQMQIIARSLQDHVGRALAQADSMLNDILEVSAESSTLSTEPTSIGVIIRNALDQVFQHLEASRICFDFDLRHNQMIDVDPVRILRVLVNIVENARQAMGHQGRIKVATYDRLGDGIQMHNMVEIVIANTGTYIPVEDRERLFDAFFTKGKLGGTGLGLAIARRVIDAHGGSIRCESSITEGTSFIIALRAAGIPDNQSSPENLPATSMAVRAAFLESMKIVPEKRPYA